MRKFRIPYIPYRSLLLSTTVLNDSLHCKKILLLHDHSVKFTLPLTTLTDNSVFISEMLGEPHNLPYKHVKLSYAIFNTHHYSVPS